MSETNRNFPIYFNGYVGNGDSMKKIAETLSKNNSPIKTSDFDKHRHLLCGNPFFYSKSEIIVVFDLSYPLSYKLS